MSPKQLNWRDELFAERSYYELVGKAWRITGNLKVKIVIAFVFFSMSFGGFAFDVYILKGKGLGDVMVTLVRALSALGLSFASAMLAFLIAGFTIFATVTKATLFEGLANIPHPGTSISRLKYIFFTFMMGFWHFIVFIVFCYIVSFIFAQGAPATMMIGYFLSEAPLVRGALIYMCFGCVVSYMLLLIIETKSFVWNTYQAILLSIAYDLSSRKKE